MTRFLAVRSKTDVQFYELGKNNRPLSTIKGRLFRTDEKFMLSNVGDTTEFVMYDLDSVIPYCIEQPDSPDSTMALIDVARSNKRAISKLSSNWLSFDKLMPILVIVLVGYGLLQQYLH